MADQMNRMRQEFDKSISRLDSVREQPDFRALMNALWNTPSGDARLEFVRDVLLPAVDVGDLSLPEGVTLQRTYFDDQRPTLFALVDHLPTGLPFGKVTITYDDPVVPVGEQPDENPYLASVDNYVHGFDTMLQDETVYETMASLPEGDHERVHAVRTLTPTDFTPVPIEGLRVCPRWFEHDDPMKDGQSALRYVYQNGYGPGYKPLPPTWPKPERHGTTCVSGGFYVCVSHGG